jgi:voltage-gated potassium channel
VGGTFIFVFFRRMRVPLVVLISAYAIATVGFTLMPGVDDEGNPWRLSLFEAFYVVSYTGSTIGFGEVPYPFSPAQRLWTTVSIYLTVIAWLFSIGTIISLLQDPAFRRSLQRARFRRAVRGIDEPFYVVCGYGDTGRLLTRALTDRHHPVVVIDHNADKIEALSVKDFRMPVAAFTMDARPPDNLVESGMRSRWCMGVMAVTGDDQANLKIAVATRLLNKRCAVHARADLPEVADNMRSFDTEDVVNPVAEYVRRMRLAIERPAAFRLYHWLQSGPHARIPDIRRPPRGPWILAGFGSLGKAMHTMLVEIGIEVTVIEEDETLAGLPSNFVRGRGTQAETLQQAGIERAVGILATTRDDVDNLSILITARELKPELFTGILENGLSSHAMVRAAEPDIVAQPSTVIAGTILSRIRSPLVQPFIEGMLECDEDEIDALLDHLSGHCPDSPPDFLTLRISERRAPALVSLIERGIEVPVSALVHNPVDLEQRLPVEVLLLMRDSGAILRPDENTALNIGDRILMAGHPRAGRRLRAMLDNENILGRALTGRDIHQGWLWRRLTGSRDLG